MSVLPWHLLPDQASVTADGGLAIAGCRLADLAVEFGTPLFVYDEAHLRTRCREAVSAFPDGVAYATKAFLCKAMARLAYEEGMDLDVATGGEIHVARSAGVPGERLVFHGSNKSMGELVAAIAAGVGTIVIDSMSEIGRLESVLAGSGKTVRVMIRVNPGIEAHTHDFLRTGAADSKFGIALAGDMAASAVRRVREAPSLELIGIHAHVGSQVFDVASFSKTVEVLAGFVSDIEVPALSVGGGLGVPYVGGEDAPSITEWGAAIRGAVAAAGLEIRVHAEPEPRSWPRLP